MKNVEIKAKCSNPEQIHEILMANGAQHKGEDHQIDTYFNINVGRLKLREGNIENNLIFYKRTDQADAKTSNFELYKPNNSSSLKNILTDSLGIKVVVDKRRNIYFIDHVKFHIDRVDQLGSFIEIEVTDMKGNREAEEMRNTCNQYIEILKIAKEDLISLSYSDMMQ